MAALTDNKYDVFNWIKKVIDSCTSYHHFRTTDNLIENFHKVYKDWQLSGELHSILSAKQYNRSKNLLKG